MLRGRDLIRFTHDNNCESYRKCSKQDRRAPQGFAPIAIGLMLALIHLITIPVTNTSVNPARSTGPALIVGLLGGKMELFGQVWLFWLAPILGASAAGFFYNAIFKLSDVDQKNPDRQVIENL